MATKKPAVKKSAPQKNAAKKTATKSVPQKTAAKPAAKPAAKKAAAKPAAKSPAKKAAAKPAPVKPAPAKPAAKPVVKPAAKPIAKPSVKPAEKKETTKTTTKKAAPEKKQEVATEVKPAPTTPVATNHKKVETPVVTKTEPKPDPVTEVKVPKTSVKTSVPYQPGYTPLEKRTETPKTNEPLVRYSDNELNEFRELINKKLEAAKKELAYLQGLITRKDDMGGDDTDNRYVTMEDGSMSMEREQLSQMASRQITYIDHLEKALIRIENKTYGICRVTGKLIDKARLRAVPHATLSLEAKLGYVKPNNNQ